MTAFRLAIAQAPAELEGSSARLAWLEARLPEIAEQKTDLVLLPELFTSGYNIGYKLKSHAETANGPITSEMAKLAETYGVAIHFGYPELAKDGIFNSAACVSSLGELIGHHRKLAIPPGFEQDIFQSGAGCELFSYRGLSIATLICYDAEFPETVRHVSELGADLVLVPTALGAKWAWVADIMMPTRAYENGVYLAYANYAGTENGLLFLGRSVISAPDGTEAARAGSEAEIIYADIDTNRIKAAQSRLPYLRDKTSIDLVTKH